MRLTIAICPVLLFLLSAGSAQVASDADNRSLGDVARETREQRRLRAADPKAHSGKVMELIADASVSGPDEYMSQISEMLSRQDYDGLERAAERARSSKSRFPGGVWKLYDFYQAASAYSGAGDPASQIPLLKHWVAQRPQSSTALIALAEAYMAIGWKARGEGLADTVTNEGWQGYSDNAELARQILLKASTLQKCPYWYEAMMHVAVAQGWSKSKTKALFEEAFAFEPSYYHTIREYANYLQAKWYGADGEAEAFAEQISNRIGGQEGDFVYFEIASLLGCLPCNDNSHLRRFAWTRVKNGYSSLEHVYGTANLKLNRFALMTTKMNDKEAARETFLRIGGAWNRDVWKREDRFLLARDWALKE